MKAIVDPSLVEKNQCACIPHVIRNKSLKPLICSHWHRILKSKNASAIREVNSGATGSAAMYVAIVHDPGMVRRKSVLCSHNEPYVSKHRCIWIIDICVINWIEKEHKSSSEMSSLEMQGGIVAVALITIIFTSLMMYHGTDMVMNESSCLTIMFSTCCFSLWEERDSWQNSPHCHFTEKSCQRAPGPSYHHFNWLFTLTSYFICALWCGRMKELLGNACSWWFWWEQCPKNLSKIRRTEKGLSHDSWTFFYWPHWISIGCQVPTIHTLTGSQDNPNLMTINIPGHFKTHIQWEFW